LDWVNPHLWIHHKTQMLAQSLAPGLSAFQQERDQTTGSRRRRSLEPFHVT
jgi:hypothetical protein